MGGDLRQGTEPGRYGEPPYQLYQFEKFIPKRIRFPEIDRQLYLKFIPLMIKKQDLENYFSKVGKIEQITMCTIDAVETSGGVGGFHQLHDYSECNNAVRAKVQLL